MNENEKAALAESIRKAPEILIKENEDYRKQLAAMNGYVNDLREQISEYQETIKAVLDGLGVMLEQPGLVSPTTIRALKAGTEKEFEQLAAKEKPLIVNY